jgi:hypothetical protein
MQLGKAKKWLYKDLTKDYTPKIAIVEFFLFQAGITYV